MQLLMVQGYFHSCPFPHGPGPGEARDAFLISGGVSCVDPGDPVVVTNLEPCDLGYLGNLPCRNTHTHIHTHTPSLGLFTPRRDFQPRSCYSALCSRAGSWDWGSQGLFSLPVYTHSFFLFPQTCPWCPLPMPARDTRHGCLFSCFYISVCLPS